MCNFQSPCYFSDGKQHKVQFLDTGGYEAFPELIECYMKKADMIIIVMEYNNKRSCAVASQIVNDIKKSRGKLLCYLCSFVLFDNNE